MKLDFRRLVLRVLGALLVVVIGALGWTGFKLLRSWNSVDRLPFDPQASRDLLGGGRGGGEEPPIRVRDPRFLPTEMHGAYLAVGTDNRPGFGGDRADVILLYIQPEDGSQPVLVSLPRDLYIADPCNGGFSRVNVNLNGCGDVSGIELLAIAVEDFTGIPIDHVALFDFEGFKEVIDALGGIDLCLENPVRDVDAELDLPAGCYTASGAQALSWVRSRKTLELVDGEWRTMRGVSDLTRNQRQQDVILQMLGKLKNFSSIGRFTSTVQGLADAFTIDEGLNLIEAANLAWSMRDMDPETIARIEIPVRNHTTSNGAAVLLPTQSFTEVLATVYPELADT